MARHEALRTTFAQIDGLPCSGSRRGDWLSSDGHYLSGIEAQAELERLAAEEAAAPFDLETGPLIRGRLMRLGEDEHALLATMHHIVSDGWSMGVLVKDAHHALYCAFRGRR